MHKTLLVSLLITFFLITSSVSAQSDLSRFRVMFWNVENLFDTKDDTLKNDSEFLPESMRHWNSKRYNKKIHDVGRAIVAVGENSMPALVGLCEVENTSVLLSLVDYSPLQEQTYRFVMTESPDERGINIALLYQRSQFKLLHHNSIRIPQTKEFSRPTRDILYACGMTLTTDTLDVFVVHFPSRSGGAKETEPFRKHVAQTLRNHTDSLMAIRKNPRIIVMGDFNDFPTNKSITEVLDAQPLSKDGKSTQLYQLLANQVKKNKSTGSYKYKGRWQLLDHIIVSGSLLDSTSTIYTTEENAQIARFPFLLTEDAKYGGMQPFRTYNGMKYLGGFSDHLPVYTDFKLKLDF